MFRFDMFAACFEAVIHGHLQAGSVALFTCFNTPLHILVQRGLMCHVGFPQMVEQQNGPAGARPYDLGR